MIQFIKNNQVGLVSGKVVRFPFPVGQAMEFDGTVVVRLEPPKGVIFNENVFGIDSDGRQIWQIQAEDPPTEGIPWGGLDNRNGQAVLSDVRSRFIYVDPKTGAITRRGMQPR